VDLKLLCIQKLSYSRHFPSQKYPTWSDSVAESASRIIGDRFWAVGLLVYFWEEIKLFDFLRFTFWYLFCLCYYFRDIFHNFRIYLFIYIYIYTYLVFLFSYYSCRYFLSKNWIIIFILAFAVTLNHIVWFFYSIIAHEIRISSLSRSILQSWRWANMYVSMSEVTVASDQNKWRWLHPQTKKDGEKTTLQKQTKSRIKNDMCMRS